MTGPSIDTAVLRAAVPKPVLEICERLHQQGHAAWVVGGCVRDHLLNTLHPEQHREPGDWDIATSALPDVVRRSFPKVIPTGLEHGTVTVMLDKMPFEVTTFRAEAGYVDGRHPGQVTFLDDISADLSRRDFTVNAIAYDPIADTLADPYDGMGDLRRRVLRAVGDPAQRFAEDGLRVLRAARFLSTLEFRLDEATALAIRPSLDSYRKVSAERIREEWFKALKTRRPSLAFDAMARHGLLEVTVPELPTPLDSDAWSNRLAWLDGCPSVATPLGLTVVEVRLAALLEPLAPVLETTPFVRCDPRAVDDVALRLKLSNNERACLVALLMHHRLPPATTSDAELRRWLRLVTPALVPNLFALATSRPNATAEERADLVLLQRRLDNISRQSPPLYVKDLAVDGKVLMSELGLKPGKHLGELLNQLLEAVLDEPGLNTRETLLLAAKELVGV